MKKIIAIISLLLVSPAVMAGNDLMDYSWYGLIPALLAIILAIVTKQVTLSLLAGVSIGSIVKAIISESGSPFWGLDNVFDNYILNALASEGHASVILFSLLIAGAIHIMAQSGAFNGLVTWLGKYAKSKRSALLISYFMGFFVFFDDYANTLVVGNTMQKITDKFKISREKLAFIVDATAAPIASIALVSTWIGYEVDLIDKALQLNPITNSGEAYAVFLNAIGYSFYPIIILVFILLLILMKKDFGPMLKFEKNPQLPVDDKNEITKSMSPIWAVLPILLLLSSTLFGIYYTGTDKTSFVTAIQSGDCYKGLIAGSVVFLFTSFLISLFHKNTLIQNVSWLIDGMKGLFAALIVLVLAWALNGVLEDLMLGEYLGSLITDSSLNAGFIPVLVFILSGIIAFSTGSSFSTMGILVPIVVTICSGVISSEAGGIEVLFASIASVLSGAVLGDHCSPISDTTVLSSMATGCNHINHVNSQLTYCLLVGLVSVGLILLNSVLHLNLAITYIIGVMLIYLIIKLLGKSNS